MKATKKSFRPLTATEVEFTPTCLPEELDFHGNASAIDEENDRATEEWIEDQLARGNDWAWCTARVTVEWRRQSADTYLGCCSYRSAEDFRSGPYYEDMCREVLDELNRQLQEDYDTLPSRSEE